jgi:hypothetical protein
MPRLLSVTVKVRDLLRVIQRNVGIWSGLVVAIQYKHPFKPGLVTIAGKPNDDLAFGTLKSILKQAGITK